MAEERLIDEDKDRKYKIRKNADGEDELYIDETDVEEDDTPVFAIPDFGEEGDEEAAVLTPEQLSERERIRAEEEQARKKKVEAFCTAVKEKMAEGDFESALYSARQAEELDAESGEVACLKLRAITREFTSFNDLEESAGAAEKVSLYADEESKAELKAKIKPLEEKIAEVKVRTEKLETENEENKARRREVFAGEKKKYLKFFTATVCTLLTLFVLTLAMSFLMFSDESGVYLVVTIALAAVTFIALIVTAIAARFFWRAQRNVKLNERDSSTELGRHYTEAKNQLELLNKIYSYLNL